MIIHWLSFFIDPALLLSVSSQRIVNLFSLTTYGPIKRNNKEGVQHLAFDCKNIPMPERKREMKARGFEPAMEGVWKGRKGTCTFCFFDTEESVGTVVESIEFSEDWEDPEHEWYPVVQIEQSV